MLYIPLTLDVMHGYSLGCYALSTAASFTLLRYLVVFFPCPILNMSFCYCPSKKGENYFATALIGYTDRGSIK